MVHWGNKEAICIYLLTGLSSFENSSYVSYEDNCFIGHLVQSSTRCSLDKLIIWHVYFRFICGALSKWSIAYVG